MHYESFEAEDFASDQTFVEWVRQPDSRLDAFWNEWLERHPEKAETIREARLLVNFLQFSTELPSLAEQEEVKQQIRAQLNSSVSLNDQRAPKTWLQIAAVVALLLMGGAALWYAFLSDPYTHYTTGYSEQREILLPDSTLVTLNANSELRIKAKWNGAEAREVWLQGEAFFKVVKKPRAADGRFIVHTERLDVEVLGTAFNVQARRGRTEVVLNEGKVKLRKPTQQESLVMVPGEKASLGEDLVLSKVKVNPERYASWKDNRLFFDNASLREVFVRIQDIHGYQIKVSEPGLLDHQFTGSCPTDDLDILFTALEETFNLEVVLQDKQIILRSKH